MNLIGMHAIKGNHLSRLAAYCWALSLHTFYQSESCRTIVQAIQGAAPVIAAFQRDRTLLTMLSLYLPSLPLHQQLIKVQLNKGAASTSCRSPPRCRIAARKPVLETLLVPDTWHAIEFIQWSCNLYRTPISRAGL